MRGRGKEEDEKEGEGEGREKNTYWQVIYKELSLNLH